MSIFLRLLEEETWPEPLWTETVPYYYNGSSEFSEAVLQDWLDASQHLQTYVLTEEVETGFISIYSIGFWHEELTLQKAGSDQIRKILRKLLKMTDLVCCNVLM